MSLTKEYMDVLDAALRIDQLRRERESKRLACELLGLGSGCRDRGCDLAGPGTAPRAQFTNGGCHCLDDMPAGYPRKASERRAVRAAIAAAAKALREETT